MRRQDVLHRHLRIRRLFDETVVAVNRRRIALRSAGDRTPRIVRQQRGALDQTCHQSLVDQGSPSKLVLSPHRAVKPGTRLKTWRGIDKHNPQSAAPARLKLVHVNRLDRLLMPMSTVLTPAPCSLANRHKIAGPQAGPVMAALDKRLNQPRPIPVAILEVPRQTPQHMPQNMARKVHATHTGTNQKSVQTDNAMKMRLPLPVAPANPAVTRRHAKRRGRKPNRAQVTVPRSNKITHLATGENRHPAWMLPRNQRVPDPPMVTTGNRNHRKIPHLIQTPRNLLRQNHARRKKNRRRSNRRSLASRQHDPIRSRRQRQQRLQAPRQLPTAPTVRKAELPTNPPTKDTATVKPLPGQNPDNPILSPSIAERAVYL